MSGDHEVIVAEGELLSEEANGTYGVRMANGHELTAFLSVKMRENRIPLLPRGKVLLEISPYDLSRGRIVAGSFTHRLGEVPECGNPSTEQNAGRQSVSRTSLENSELKVASGEAIPMGGLVVP